MTDTKTANIETVTTQAAIDTVTGGQDQQFDVIDGEQIPRDLSQIEDPDLRDYYQLVRDNASGGSQQDGNTAAGTEQTTQPGGAATDTVTAPAASDAGGNAPQTPMIPKARLDEALSRADALRQQVAFLQGKVSALETTGGTPAAPGAGQQQVQQVDELEAAQAELESLADQFDQGELTAKQWEQKRATVQSRIDGIKEARILAKVNERTAPATDPTNELAVQERIAQIEAQHPYANLVFPEREPTDPQQRQLTMQRVEMIRTEAIANLTNAHPGMQFSDANPRHRLMLIEEQARLTDTYGPHWFPNANVVKPAGNGAAAAGGAKPLSPQANDRLLALQTAGNQPANIHTMGAPSGGTQQIDEASIAQMSDDEILRLPQSLRDKHLGIT